MSDTALFDPPAAADRSDAARSGAATDRRAEHVPTRRQQLGHDAKNYLAIVTMGLELLPSLRGDDDAFEAMVAEIRREGIEPLREALGELTVR